MNRRDITDTNLRRAVRALGFKGKLLSLSICDILAHPNRPGEDVLLQFPGEKRRDAVDRLRKWAWNKE
jgi:hypothetical protein